MHDKIFHRTDNAFTALDPMIGPAEHPYAGAPSMFRRPYTKHLKGVDVAFMGIPWDAATTGRPGARSGPRGIRLASSIMSWGVPFSAGFDVFSHLHVVDYGDAFVDNFSSQLVFDSICDFVRPVVQSGITPIVLGGDHHGSYPVLKCVRDHVGEPLSLIHFDAHTDTWPYDGGRDRMDHGTMFRRAIEEGLIDPSSSVQIGIRTHNSDTMGVHIVTGPQLLELTPRDVARIIAERVGTRACYLTFDVDVLDPSVAPGTGTPVAGGPSSAYLLDVIRRLHTLDIRCYDIVEVSPIYDHAEITALAASQIAMEFLVLQARKKLAPNSPHKQPHSGVLSDG